MMELVWMVLLIVIAVVVVITFFSFVPLGLWISARASGVKISIATLVGMRFRRISPVRIVQPLIMAVKAGLTPNIGEMEAHYLAGGNVDRVIRALITAQGANIDLNFEEARSIDLAGRDVLQAVQMSVNPKVIETPVVAAIAKDGIELRAKARVTVRANIERLVGGAGEETIRRPRRRGHRHDRRLRGDAQVRPGKPGPDQPHRPGQGPGCRNGV